MASILILTPALFTCFSKFSRKLDKILSQMDDYRVIYPDDAADMITRYFSGQAPAIRVHRCTDWHIADVTHAIVFDDGEEFSVAVAQLQAADVSLRRIDIAITRVINLKREPRFEGLKSTPDYEYIGRGAYWGNPYSMYEEGEAREEVIRKYQYDFDYDKFPRKDKANAYRLAGKRLGCFCKPDTCHGDVLANFLNAWDDGK